MESETEANPQNRIIIPNEIWIKSFSYLEANHLLHSVALVDRSFLDLSSDDSIWQDICMKRWMGKLNVQRFFVSNDSEYQQREGVISVGLAVAEEGGRVSADRSGDGRRTSMTYCYELIQQFGSPESLPPLNMGSLMHRPISWKEAYWMAEMDSRRQTISREEVVYYRFRLEYMGQPSKMGVRQFNADGTCDSPYMGLCDWSLHRKHLLFAGMFLMAGRDKENWGWIIGEDKRTVYFSVEEKSDEI
ncbi:hypothetical protein HJC23_005368 [Cyclotella cryptica]|uniref:F-box domain-containing protein n=1 Tax=Cyclotella cryptica TaxID=29204 RepID=A0ABD3NUX2_9STRA|eukprot:CCRYP_020241-RA/>CCRYP_020241-RA protein AED:0.05 eAED:0.05 QI:0/-1/0/1/-1/1/1/0/245